jgi:hypothetical protein
MEVLNILKPSLANAVKLIFFTVINTVTNNVEAEQLPGDVDNLF